MKKIHIYNAIERVKGYFSPAPVVSSGVGVCAARDAKILALLRRQAAVFTVSNGRKYWYFIPHKAENLKIAQMLLARNGLDMHIRHSDINYGEIPVLRTPAEYIKKDEELMAFVCDIMKAHSKEECEQAYQDLLFFQAQLNQKVK